VGGEEDKDKAVKFQLKEGVEEGWTEGRVMKFGIFVTVYRKVDSPYCRFVSCPDSTCVSEEGGCCGRVRKGEPVSITCWIVGGGDVGGEGKKGREG
jgi:hypothetical protein